MQKLQIKLKGFTLLELIVVMGIIAILAALGIVGILQLQRSSRDQARVAKMAAINKELQDFKRIYLRVPDPLQVSLSSGALIVEGERVLELDDFMSPDGVTSANGTLYYLDTSDNAVVLCAFLENNRIERLDDSDCPSDITIWPAYTQ